jgi:hypothetical protein
MEANNKKKKSLLKIAPDLDDSLHILLRESQIAQNLLQLLSSFVKSFNDDYLDTESWFVFHAWLDVHPTSDSPYYSLFQAWQLFHWNPDPSTVQPKLFNKKVKTLASAFIKVHHDQLNDEQVQMLERAQKQQLDIYEITSLNQHYLTLYGIISQTKIVVYHPNLSTKARVGEYIFASTLPVNQMQHVFLGVSQFFPREAKVRISEFSRFLSRCKPDIIRDFKNFESDIFNLFYDLNQEFKNV